MGFDLIADIGGTNARFARVDAAGIHDERVLKVADYDGPVAAARAYLAQLAAAGMPDAATFAVAGPVTGDDRFVLTNFPWDFSIEKTRQELGLVRLDLINDFHAMALGVLNADQKNIRAFGGGQAQPQGNIAVIGPGTGLGVATLVWDPRGGYYVPVAGEGPHVTLPVKTDREWAIVKWLLDNKYSHVSAERVCSGKGLINLHIAISGLDGLPERDIEAEEITAKGLSGECPVCAESLDLMLGFLGRIAGNLALIANARGGVFFCGGILPRLGLDKVAGSCLRSEFVAKGRMTGLVELMPTYLVDDPFLPLKGLRAHTLGQ